jgi:deoxyribodipyrimidine photo-lyase
VPSFNFATFDFSPLDAAGTLDRVLPAWAKATLAKHAGDRREHLYSLAEFEAAATHDDLWNAAQTELVRTGRIHNYLRMLWAKKVLEWSPSAKEAYRVLEHLNNKYAIDGRDPNSYTGILWCFGLFDRPWAPERNVFGSVRYMSSDNTARKFKLGAYLDYVAGLTPPPP